MAIPVQTILTRLQNQLLDPTFVFWQQAELIDYINGGQLYVLSEKPDAFTKTAPATLVLNTPTQTFAGLGISDGYCFLDIVRQITPVSRGITQIEQNHLDHADPSWPTTLGDTIYHYMFDPRNPNVFYVYQVPNVPVSVEITYSAEPPPVTAPTDTVQLDSIYIEPLYFATLGTAYAKNAKRGDMQKSEFYFQLSSQLLGVKFKIQRAFSPETPQSLPPNVMQPTTPGQQQ